MPQGMRYSFSVLPEHREFSETPFTKGFIYQLGYRNRKDQAYRERENDLYGVSFEICSGYASDHGECKVCYAPQHKL